MVAIKSGNLGRIFSTVEEKNKRKFIRKDFTKIIIPKLYYYYLNYRVHFKQTINNYNFDILLAGVIYRPRILLNN